jgi:stage V sporulation protein B
MIFTFFFSDTIASTILKNPDSINCIYASLLMIPLTGLSALIKGYFLGKGEISLTSSSQTYEEAGRLLFIIIIVTIFSSASIPLKASFAVYSLAFGEIFQIGYMILFSSINKKNIFFTIRRNFTESKSEIRPLLNLSIPLTLSRIVGSITYIFEPIIFTNLMLGKGLDITNVTIEYGVLSSYVMPLLLMPSFISVALSNYLLPNMGKLIGEKKDKQAVKLLIKITLICLFIGFFISITFFIFGEFFLNLLYDTSLGLSYLKVLSFPFILYYIEAPIIASLNIYELSKKSFIATIISSITRIIFMFPLINKFGVIGISFATLIGIIIDVILNIIFLIFFFKRNKIQIIN